MPSPNQAESRLEAPFQALYLDGTPSPSLPYQLAVGMRQSIGLRPRSSPSLDLGLLITTDMYRYGTADDFQCSTEAISMDIPWSPLMEEQVLVAQPSKCFRQTS
jgi:hypothetical protein